MAPAVYLLCALTALACAALLLRGYLKSRARLLLWDSICFVGLMVNNALVFVDLVLVRDVDLFVWRNVAALGGVAMFAFGLIWDSQ